jgi:hypothetical protein
MRWTLLILVAVLGCHQRVPRKPYRPPPPMTVEETASWFMKAALSGDDATARLLVLRFDQVAQFSAKANEQEWEAAVNDALDHLAKEGGGEDEWKITASVVEQKTLEPGEKVLVPTEIAVVQLSVNDHESPMPWLFIRTSEGWRYSPKK